MTGWMIALQVAGQVAGQAAAPPVLQALERQALPARGCAAYLWSRADRRFVAVAGADPAGLRVATDGRVADLPRETQGGAAQFGLSERASYRGSDLVATLDMTVTPSTDMTDGASVPDATLTISRPGSDAVVLPVAGLIGCRPASGVEIRPRSVR